MIQHLQSDDVVAHSPDMSGLSRVQTEKELRRTTRLLNGILSDLPVIACSVDADGTILETRGRGLETIGLREGQLIGKKFQEIYPQVAGDLRKALDGGSSTFLWPVQHAGRAQYFDSYLQFDSERGRGAIGFSVNVTARIEAETDRKSRSQLLRSVMKSMPVIVGRLDADGRVVEAHGDGLVPRGLDPRQLTGKDFARLYSQSRDAIARAQRKEEVSFTLSGRTHDADWHAEFSVMADSEMERGVTFFGRDVTERRWLERRILTISDSEQQRIGADLHDGLGQQLTGLACLAAAMRDRLKMSHPEESEQAALIARLANESTMQARALARGLCPVQLEQSGLLSALEDLACQSQLLLGISCEFRTKGPPPHCDHMTAIHLYRITQEAINNAARHGYARRVCIALVSRGSRHRLIVTDDGRGFDSSAARPAPGGGLRLMNYRATVIGADFSLVSRPGRGTRVTCSFSTPFNEKDFLSQTEAGSHDTQATDSAGR
jgi:signal transduction histidine kinase